VLSVNICTAETFFIIAQNIGGKLLPDFTHKGEQQFAPTVKNSDITLHSLKSKGKKNNEF